MKILLSIILVLVISLFTFGKIDKIDLSGKWNVSRPHSTFSLNLHENSGGHITGSHISVQNSGNKIDSRLNSADITITGSFNSSTEIATVSFKSSFCSTSGTATIRKINANQIEWKITIPPPGEYHIPNIDTLTKQ